MILLHIPDTCAGNGSRECFPRSSVALEGFKNDE